MHTVELPASLLTLFAIFPIYSVFPLSQGESLPLQQCVRSHNFFNDWLTENLLLMANHFFTDFFFKRNLLFLFNHLNLLANSSSCFDFCNTEAIVLWFCNLYKSHASSKCHKGHFPVKCFIIRWMLWVA